MFRTITECPRHTKNKVSYLIHVQRETWICIVIQEDDNPKTQHFDTKTFPRILKGMIYPHQNSLRLLHQLLFLKSFSQMHGLRSHLASRQQIE